MALPLKRNKMKKITYRLVGLLLALMMSFSAFAAKTKTPTTDDAIFDNVRRKLASDPDVRGGTLEVSVAAGVVTLKGNLEQNSQKSKAEKLTKKVPGVKSVVNSITIAPVRSK